MDKTVKREAAEALLRWYASAGVHDITGERPIDRYAESAHSTKSPAKPPARPPTKSPAKSLAKPSTRPPSASVVSLSAEQLAQSAQTLAELRAALEGFDGCALKASARNLVFSDGDPGSGLMLIGEAPGRDEDIQGKPFVGRAGQLLDKMLAAIDLDRTGIYISNILFWRPPGNRTPSAEEQAQCWPFVERHIALVRPKILLLAGSVAAKTILDTQEGVTRLRGRWFDIKIGGLAIPALVMFHPAYLLRQPAQKALAWRDMLALKGRLEAMEEG